MTSFPARSFLALAGLVLASTSTVAYAGAAAAPASTAAAAPRPAPIRALMVAGGCCHDYNAQSAVLKAGLESRANITIDVLYNPGTGMDTTFPEYRSPDWAKGYDLVIHNECSANVTDAEYIRNVIAPHAAGIPAVFIHCAMHSYRTQGWNAGAVTPWFELTGLQTSGHGAQGAINVTYFDRDSTITRGLKPWTTPNDELYNNYTGGLMPTARAIALGRQGNVEAVVAWTNLYKQKARVFGVTLGHNNAVLNVPDFMDLLARGTLWTVDRLNDQNLKVAPAPAAAATEAPKPILPVAECGCASEAEAVN